MMELVGSGVLAKPTPRNVNFGSVRFAMFNHTQSAHESSSRILKKVAAALR
jgi:hypothetical protein